MKVSRCGQVSVGNTSKFTVTARARKGRPMALRADDVDLGRDRALVKRYQGGDQRAFDDLYTRYFNRLTRYCARRVSDDHAAQDIAQEAFVRALRALPGLEGDRRFYPWMTVIANRLCVDHHRRNGRYEMTDSPDLGTSWDDDSAPEREADLVNLGAAMERLAPRHREVLDLRERNGMTYADIAQHLDVPTSTVEALLHRARKALRREFVAVSGESLGRLGALPGLAWLTDRAVRLRDRIPALAEAVRPLALGVAGVAMVAAPVALVDVGDRGGAAPTEAAITTSASPWSSIGMADLAAEVRSGRTERLAPRSETLAPGTAPGDEVEEPHHTHIRLAGPELKSGRDAADAAEDEPVIAVIGPAVISADPAEIVYDTVDLIEGVTR